jgi:osmotically-inducible protein OsmY
MQPPDREGRLPGDAVLRWTGDDAVAVEGSVRSFAEHEAALRAAWNTPGVRRVHDNLGIRL